MPFPVDDYTTFGYLANPFHRARSRSESEAGLLRSADDVLGFGWVEPTARKVDCEAAIVLALRWGDRVYQTRADFARLGYRSRHHTSTLFSFDWELGRVVGRMRFALAERDILISEIVLSNPGALAETIDLFVLGRIRGQAGHWTAQQTDDAWTLQDPASGREFGLIARGVASSVISPEEITKLAPNTLADARAAVGFSIPLTLAPGNHIDFGVALIRGVGVRSIARSAADQARAICTEKQASDDAFYDQAALPVGDWPAEWKRGWIYDLETTRACIFPPGGIFHGPWPSWMVSWPRVVLAEGTLDLARLSYAAPDLALRAARTLLVDAPASNVPCVFQGGEPNMVARDGTICGTSPAWCLPFHNLWLLYCRTLDRAWLAEVFPRLEAYLEYWLRERTDEDGWIVYKCTWEAGEDCTPRLDPSGSGDDVISHHVRPIELQATLSHSAAILARFAQELGLSKHGERWAAVAREYARRTQTLWDPDTGRFRDWDKRTGRFLAAPGDPTYWKTDPVRFSALSLTPLVARITTPDQQARLRDEIAFYDAPPWCLWPSWSYVVAEAATAAGWYDVAGAFARRVVERVYRQNDRRSIEAATRPTPGTAPEFWPLDLADFNGSDGYGWGATTTSLWVRQIFGFLDGEDPSEFSFSLAPSLPEEFLVPGRRYGFAGLPYRGTRLDLAYEILSDRIDAVVRVDRRCDLEVSNASGTNVPARAGSDAGESRFPVQNGERFLVVIREARG